MALQIFVEDQLTDAYEILVLRALGLPTSPRNRRQVRASRIDIDDLTTLEGLFDLTQRAWKSGFDCILFLMDEEGPRSGDRPAKLESFRQAFQALCDHHAGLKRNNPLQGVKVARIVCKRCLESWLASDPPAIVDSVRGRRGVDYTPEAQRTEDLLPEQASERIAQIIRETGRRLERQDLRRISANSIKSRGASIAEHVAPERARRYNFSLDYFFEMSTGQRSGCDHPFPSS